MYDYANAMQLTRDYYASQPTDQPWTLMGFRGTFNFRDHSTVPELIQTYVLAATRYERFKQVPLEEVNRLAREIHGGEPGVPLRIIDRMVELHRERRARRNDTTNPQDDYEPELTIDDWNSDAPSPEKETNTDDT